MRKSLLMVSLAACCAMVLASSVALAGDNWVGTWKLDSTKSTYSPGPAPKSQTVKWELTPKGIKFVGDGVAADGKATHSEYVSHFDGKDIPYTGNPDADMASPNKVDDNHYVNTWWKAGKATIVAKVAVSADGKTLTVTQAGTNAKGQAVSNTAVYTRQ